MNPIKLVLFLLALTAPLGAVSPMNYYTALVAGNDDAGYQDGAFDDARFNQPTGLAFDDKGRRLFVADSRNNRIRVIYMDEDNRVETLAGSGSENKDQEGSLSHLSLAGPLHVLYLPGDHLVVYCLNDQSLKWIDLGTKTFRTLGKDVGPIWDMAYRAEDNALYLTDPLNNRLDRFDLTTDKVTIAFQNNPVLTSPTAICVHEGNLFVSDGKNSAVYRIERATGTEPSAIPTVMSQIAAGDGIEEMAFAGGALYALQDGDQAMVVLWPEPRTVRLPSMGGFLLSNKDAGYFPMIAASKGSPVGFAVSPRESDRFFIAQPRTRLNCVISVKDDHFAERWYARDPPGVNRELTDFDYPAQKPAKTFRILVVGTSRVVTAPAVLSDEELKNSHMDASSRDFHSLRLDTFAKKLELLLNTEAALEGVSEHFEVLELGRPGLKLPFFVNQQVPTLVEKYDVDLVLGLLTPTFEEAFEDYFTRPLTPDGIPGPLDPEYLTKPWQERVPPGVPKHFLDQCFELKLVKEQPPGQLKFLLFQDVLNNGGTDIRNDLLEMLGKPLQVLDRRLKSLKVRSSGRAPQLKFFFVPDPDCDAYEHYESFWSDLCVQNNLDLLDLSKPYEDLRYSYYPATEACCHQHYSAYGNELIAQLLLHYLPQKGWIPLGPGAPSK